MSGRLLLVSIAAALCLAGIVLELVRRRRLQERYSVLWLATATVVVVVAAVPGVLDTLASTAGIAYPPSALFVVAGAFFLLMLLHFSTAISRLSEQNQRLAQHVGLLEERLAAAEHAAQRDEVPARLHDLLEPREHVSSTAGTRR